MKLTVNGLNFEDLIKDYMTTVRQDVVKGTDEYNGIMKSMGEYWDLTEDSIQSTVEMDLTGVIDLAAAAVAAYHLLVVDVYAEKVPEHEKELMSYVLFEALKRMGIDPTP